MNTTAFCYWLQGLYELANPTSLDARQTELIKRHLAMVFQHDIDQRIPPENQAAQQAIHDGVDDETRPWDAINPVGRPQADLPSWAGGASKDEYNKMGRPRC